LDPVEELRDRLRRRAGRRQGEVERAPLLDERGLPREEVLARAEGVGQALDALARGLVALEGGREDDDPEQHGRDDGRGGDGQRSLAGVHFFTSGVSPLSFTLTENSRPLTSRSPAFGGVEICSGVARSTSSVFSRFLRNFVIAFWSRARPVTVSVLPSV